MAQFNGEHSHFEDYYLAKDGQRTFQHDESLPPLPVPDLQQTLNKYLLSVKPHLSDAEFMKTKHIVEKFEKIEGPKLQNMILERASKHKNWLEDWWLSYAYLKLRIPIAPYMNVCGAGPYFNHYWTPQQGTQIERAALSTYYHLNHWKLMREEKLLADSGRSGKEKWSMAQFKRLYNCCRIPGEHEDTIIDLFKTELEGDSPTHIALFCSGRVFTFNAVNTDGSILTPPHLETVYRHVKELCAQRGPGIKLSYLTTDERTNFYHNRERLIRLDSRNLSNLSIIESALFTVALIDDAPTNTTQTSREGFLGASGNVWYDKSYNAMYFSNGMVANNCDHAPMDAMTSVSLCWYIDHQIIKCQGRWLGDLKVNRVPLITELDFTVDDHILKEITRLERNYITMRDSMELINPDFRLFGKDLLRKYKLHQDTFVQVCLQAAYYRMHGKPAPTYETATTRKFYNARTETVRSCTNQATDFAKAYINPNVSSSEKVKLFHKAVSAHLKQMRDCMNGQGIDRHLLGLKVCCIENNLPIPEIFTNPAFQKSGGDGNYILSTSFIGFTSIHGGVAPMCKNGYGFFYRMGTERMVFWVTSWTADKETSGVKLFNHVTDIMQDVIKMIDETPKSAL